MKPFFDFDGNGSMDALELLLAVKNDPSNPLPGHDDKPENDDEDEFYGLFDNSDD